MRRSRSNPKTAKGIEYGYENAILHLAPYTIADVGNVCPESTSHCRRLCLHHCGHGGIISKKWKTNQVIRARIAKTRSFMLDRMYFMAELSLDIEIGKEAAIKKGLKFCVRLNGTSDIDFENIPIVVPNHHNGNVTMSPNIMTLHKEIQFYDYTKIYSRLLEPLPENYNLMFSYSGENKRECMKALKKGINVAVIFDGPLPEEFWNYEVISGDHHDLRFLDPKGVIVGLSAKGVARNANAENVIRTK